MASYNWNWPAVVSNAGPIQFLLNGVTTTVSEDTGTPANSRPLPVTLLDPSGAVYDTNYGAVGAHTLRTAAQIGNATGAASFGSGVIGAQVLRVGLASDQLSVLATQTTLADLDSKFGTLGQKNMAGSAPVVIASDQSAIPITAASLPLPTGAATEATLAALSAKFGSLGQKAMAGSAPVVIASDQSAIAVTVASLPLPSGAATSALQTTGNTSLASIDGKMVDNFGAASAALRVAAIPGNVSGIADFAAGTTGAQTPRVTANITRNGTELSYNSGTVDANTQRVVLPTDQPAVPTKAPVNANGSIVNTALTATTASSAAAPANSVGFILEAPSTNTDPIRWCIGSTASTTVGMLAEPGRDSGFVPCAATISICATVSGTNAFSIQWILSA